MYAPLTQRGPSGLSMLSRHRVETGQGNELTRNSPGKARPRSSHLAEPLCTDAWPKTDVTDSAARVVGLLFTSVKRNKVRQWCWARCGQQ